MFDDNFEIIEIIEFGVPRQVHVRNNHFYGFDDKSFFKRFRLISIRTGGPK
jgi:hypothetical protein